ncbi:hypothetical protein LB517_28360 [Mesorhizobium sp. BR1-1-12]|uniref:hypothetical protein n=1 Tax=Mesorhizobium sp. BR1-1-12 TaxID=2876657 RepID=UPI001CD079E0|nr:hypothetical protein [Mesorhizobium sp. BR1-1-12]MBZ9973548.1 hypothetical protein [Mesorhizobium sp. BR1-1-12]
MTLESLARTIAKARHGTDAMWANYMGAAEAARREVAKQYADAVEPHAEALRMVREAVGEIFGPVANMESEDARLLRGPEPRHEAEAIIAALQNVAAAYRPA